MVAQLSAANRRTVAVASVPMAAGVALHRRGSWRQAVTAAWRGQVFQSLSFAAHPCSGCRKLGSEDVFLFLHTTPMASTRPYQPALLRLLHGGTALLAALAWFSGLVLLTSLDGRWGHWSWPLPLEPEAWIDLHGSVGLVLLVVGAVFVLYALTLGQRRLRQWTNLVPLLALLLALVSGKLMDEDWLRQGLLEHPIYALHLTAWVVLALAVPLHLVGLLRRGGWPLLRSISSLQLRSGDGPSHWPAQLQAWWQRR